MTEEEMAGWHQGLNGHEFEIVKMKEAWRAAVHGVSKSQRWLRTTTTILSSFKDKRCLGWWAGTSEGRKTIDMEVKKIKESKYLVNKCLPRPWRNNGIQSGPDL